ncbi:uncharacterized protein [Palaemon carinicauda]|uniref:uncharacterized protein isoform X2 n=1 Tax=Palaemon carinicauda TaxID=392227 RepID=UPI0035B574CA
MIGARYKKLYYVILFSSVWGFFFLAPYIISHGYRSIKYYCTYGCQGSPPLIDTPTCVIPDFDPNHPSIVQFRERKTEPKELVCSNKDPITEVSGLNLVFHVDRLPLYGSTQETTSCYYQAVLRLEQKLERYDINCDNKYYLGKKIPITSSKTHINDDAIAVTCDDSQYWWPVYKDVHYFIQPRRAKEKMNKFKEEIAKKGKRPEKLNIIIMGTDSVSRGNLRRHMPKTFDYLKNELHAIDLQGFNKIGDNTNPNFVAMLVGLTHDDLNELNKPKRWSEDKFDDYPFIWKNFSENGYVTIYSEDSPNLGTFTYQKFGFVQEPTDYYTRPYFIASDEIIGHRGNGPFTVAPPCQGSKWSIKIIHELSLNMAEFLKEVPYFGLFWTASLTHDALDSAAIADEPSVDYLKQLYEGGYLENSVLLFLSDHGLRFGEFRKTYPGLLEERMPYVMIKLPDWFKDEYPDAYNNMATNTRRLTSTFDLYVTLRDILRRDYATLGESIPAKYGQSLFQEVPLNRTCEDAGIPDKYCSCQNTEEADPTDYRLHEAADAAIQVLNEGLKSFSNCTILSLDKVINGRIGQPKEAPAASYKYTIFIDIIVLFVTKPGQAEMEAHLQFHGDKYHLMSDVSRINKYGNQSHCIHDVNYMKYCFCQDMLPKI